VPGLAAMSSPPLESQHKVVIYTKVGCPACERAKAVFGVPPGASGPLPFLPSTVTDVYIRVLDPAHVPADALEFDRLAVISGRRTVPVVFVGGSWIGGGDDTVRLGASGELLTLLATAGAVGMLLNTGIRLPPGHEPTPAPAPLVPKQAVAPPEAPITDKKVS
jgi:glutaredoxin 3